MGSEFSHSSRSCRIEGGQQKPISVPSTKSLRWRRREQEVEQSIRLGVAVESLAQTYARVLNPTGAVTAADKANAHEILNKYWADEPIDAGLDQMEQEIVSATQSLSKTRTEMNMTPLDDEGGGTKQGGGAHPPGNYNYDPATGNLEPVK